MMARVLQALTVLFPRPFPAIDSFKPSLRCFPWRGGGRHWSSYLHGNVVSVYAVCRHIWLYLLPVSSWSGVLWSKAIRNLLEDLWQKDNAGTLDLATEDLYFRYKQNMWHVCHEDWKCGPKFALRTRSRRKGWMIADYLPDFRQGLLTTPYYCCALVGVIYRLTPNIHLPIYNLCLCLKSLAWARWFANITLLRRYFCRHSCSRPSCGPMYFQSCYYSVTVMTLTNGFFSRTLKDIRLTCNFILFV